MSNLATVIGLCCLDTQFRQHVKNGEPGKLRHFHLTRGDCAKLAKLRAVLETCEVQFSQIENAISGGWQAMARSASDDLPCENPPCE